MTTRVVRSITTSQGPPKLRATFDKLRSPRAKSSGEASARRRRLFRKAVRGIPGEKLLNARAVGREPIAHAREICPLAEKVHERRDEVLLLELDEVRRVVRAREGLWVIHALVTRDHREQAINLRDERFDFGAAVAALGRLRDAAQREEHRERREVAFVG